MREVEAAVKGQQPSPESVIGPTAPGRREAGTAEENGEGGNGAGVALALESVRRAFYEAEAFVDKVRVGRCVPFVLLARENRRRTYFCRPVAERLASAVVHLCLIFCMPMALSRCDFVLAAVCVRQTVRC